MVGPLRACAPGFAAELVARGYRPRSAAAQMALMADVSAWLADHGLDHGEVVAAGAEAAGRIGALLASVVPQAAPA